ncbi:PREDICTED: homeobox-leucine zipper protein ATHB-52-like [Populus euphratica]|uniref:Homeobox-leucine zipper protein n=1 Tax=Populus euphratica TaxID=75702 RepID=A0AAJ6XSM6_POPEU|nr:PREDICTED: homeobox-leucine zipper protein ATHB-52-like [Populus euphratica]
MQHNFQDIFFPQLNSPTSIAMDFFHSQNQHSPKHQNSSNKKRLTHDQVRLLERTFTTTKKLEPELKVQLANQLGVPPRQIAIWYQNKRARWKTQSLELDYNTLRAKLEDALADRRRLEREVVQLQEELRRAQQMVFHLNQGPGQPPVNVSSNSSCDEGGSSSLHEEANGEFLQIEELYACLYGSGGSTWG